MNSGLGGGFGRGFDTAARTSTEEVSSLLFWYFRQEPSGYTMTVSPLGKVFIVCPKSPEKLKKQKNNGSTVSNLIFIQKNV